MIVLNSTLIWKYFQIGHVEKVGFHLQIFHNYLKIIRLHCLLSAHISYPNSHLINYNLHNLSLHSILWTDNIFNLEIIRPILLYQTFFLKITMVSQYIFVQQNFDFYILLSLMIKYHFQYYFQALSYLNWYSMLKYYFE